MDKELTLALLEKAVKLLLPHTPINILAMTDKEIEKAWEAMMVYYTSVLGMPIFKADSIIAYGEN